jgi:hexosaminidase
LFESTNVEYMLLPRLLALAEAVWSPKDARNWTRFEQHLPDQKKRLGALGYNYCDEVGLIKDEPKK